MMGPLIAIVDDICPKDRTARLDVDRSGCTVRRILRLMLCRGRRWGLASIALGMVGTTALASPTLHIHDADGRLGTVDIGTGIVTIVGTMREVLGDIAFAPNGDLYGVSIPREPESSRLYRVNPLTATLTEIGPLGAASVNALVFAADGTLFAANRDGNLFTVSPDSGAATFAGQIGFESSGDLAFDGNGTLYMTSTLDHLIRIDPASGRGTDVGQIGFRDVFGLAFATDGTMYGYAGTQIFSIDLVTGAGTLVLDYSGKGLAIAYGGSFTTEARSGSSVVVHIVDDTQHLAAIDVDTGAVTIFGRTGTQLGDIAFASDGTLYGVSTPSPPTPSQLYEINSRTGELSPVGALGVSEVNGLAFGPDGTLYAASRDGSLYVVDRLTGLAILVGLIGYGSSGDIAFDGRGDLYLASTTGHLVRVDPATGAGVDVGPIGYDDVFGLAFNDADGVMYGVTRTTVLAIDLASGSGSFVLDYAGRGITAAYGASAVPAASVPPLRCNRDGIADPGEECDDGNEVEGDCCSSSCHFQPGAPGCPALELVSIPANGTAIQAATTIDAARRYAIVITGTYRYDIGEPGQLADALYREDDRHLFSIRYDSLRFNGHILDARLADPATHTYVLIVAGGTDTIPEGSRLSFNIADDDYLDNAGYLTATIYDLGRKRPAIFIPGVYGTSICGSSSPLSPGENCVGRQQLWPALSPCQVTDLAADPDGVPLEGNPGEVVHRAFFMDVYGDGLTQLSRGLAETHQLIEFPYDWRENLSDTAARLRDRIAELSADSGFQRVDIVAHSMGGLVAKALLAQARPNEALIRRIAFVGTPHFGAPQAIRALLEGNRLAEGRFADFIADSPDALTSRAYAARNMPAAYQLLPSRRFLDRAGAFLWIGEKMEDLDSLSTFQSTPVSAFPMVFTSVPIPIDGFDAAAQQLQADSWPALECSACIGVSCRSGVTHESTLNREYFDQWTQPHALAWDDWFPSDPGLEAFVLYGNLSDSTVCSVTVVPDDGSGPMVFPHDRCDGDETVPLPSASAAGLPYFDPARNPERRFAFGLDHLDLMSNGDSLGCIARILQQDRPQCAQNGGSGATAIAAARIEWTVSGIGAKPSIEDRAGHITGYTVDGTFAKEIPGSRLDPFTGGVAISVIATDSMRATVSVDAPTIVYMRVRYLMGGRAVRDLYYSVSLAVETASLTLEPDVSAPSLSIDSLDSVARSRTIEPIELPVADAGADFTVAETIDSTLDASASMDWQGRPLLFHWTQVKGPAVALSDPATTHPVFTAPKVESDTVLTFALQVVAGGVPSLVDTLAVRVLHCSAEVCNGRDDDCNGEVDESDPDTGTGCVTASAGQCSDGVVSCLSGRLTCLPIAGGCPAPACPDDQACDDGTFCNGSEVCIDGACVAHTSRCGNPCMECNESLRACIPIEDCVPPSGCSASPQQTPILAADVADAIDFGTAAVGLTLTRSIHMSNEGCGLLDISAEESCQDFAVSASAIQLAGGHGKDIQVGFSPVAAGSVSCPLRIVSNGGQVDVTLRGIGGGASTPPPTHCPGDCSGDGTVTVNELVRGVAIALGHQPVAACTAFDINADGMVKVNELVRGVNAALFSCAN